MTDELDARLRRSLRAVTLPAAPESLRVRSIAIAGSPVVVVRPRAPRMRLAIAVAAVLLLAALIAVAANLGRPRTTSVDGLTVMTVSEAMSAHAAGTLPGGRAAIKGWWSNGSIGHSCAPSTEPVGDLELYCHDGEYGIAEENEPVMIINVETGEITYHAHGPWLTPYVDSGIPGIDQLFELRLINGQWMPPVPIVVVGHFDDPRAADCNPANVKLCRDRLVLERVVEFDLGSVATPGVTPTPTPFPDPAPSGAFAAAQCAGDVPYSFVGWTTTSELDMQFERPGHVFAMVTRDPVLLTEDGWADDPNRSGHEFQIWARKVCISVDGDTMEYSWVSGTPYVVWDDGLRVPGPDPVRPSAT